MLRTRRKLTIAAVALCAAALAAGNDKPKSSSSQTVDSGSFGVFVKGQRVVTETFSVQQENGVNLVKSQLKEVASANPATQKSTLEMSAAGELLRYDWSDGISSLTVTPNNDFLIEKISAGSGKPAEQPFLLPNTSSILDNNFFIHREVLAWRYLATNCHTDKGQLQCQNGPVEFGTLVPQDRSSMRVRMQLVGPEKVSIRGAERELLRLNLTGESFSWALWVDDKDQFKLMRVVIADDNTEVVRD